MKIAFSSTGNDLDAPLDPRFGRAPKFVVYDLDKKTFEVIDNEQNYNAAQGAGIQSAETVARLGAKAVVTGHCGPKAFRVLSAAGIKIHYTNLPTVAAALNEYCTGKIPASETADVEGHWG